MVVMVPFTIPGNVDQREVSGFGFEFGMLLLNIN